MNEYTEAIRRNPQNANYLCNRAEALMKVLSFNDANKDCDKAIELDNKFLRAYLLKANSLMMLKQYDLALVTFELGLSIKTDDLELNEAKKKCLEIISNKIDEVENQKIVPEEIKNLLLDPRVKNLIETLRSNPSFAHEFIKNDKFLNDSFIKLVKHGIISDTK